LKNYLSNQYLNLGLKLKLLFSDLVMTLTLPLYFATRIVSVIGCLHDLANVQQTSSKLPENVQLHYNIWQQTFSKRPTSARVFWIHLLEICWTFAGSCKHPISDVKWPATQHREYLVATAEKCVRACGSEPAKFSAAKGTIFSPGYHQEKYPNEAFCRWIIEAPEGKVRH